MSKVRVRPPNKKRHDEHIEQLANAIKEKDSEIKLSQEFVATNEDSLGRIREEKNALYRKKQKISDSVAQVNKTRSKEFDALTKIKSHLPCRNETSLTQRIERLEQQMICNSYSLQEEKRLVNEISALKKSFHTLKQAQAQENKCHDISNQQKELREHRDDLQKMITKLKEQEQGVKVELLKHKGLIEQLTADVGELREERRQAGIDYRNLVKEYGEQQKRKRFVNAKQKEQAKKEAIEKHERELAEYEAGRRPNEDEIQQCETLIQYLHSLTAGISPPHAQSDPIKTDVPTDHVGEKVVNKAVRVNEEASFEGMELLKHNDNDAMYGAKPKIKSGKKNKRKHNTNKSIRHTSTEIFAQFEKVHVKTPLTMADIPHAIHDLKKKLLYYNEQSPLGLKPSIHAFRDSDSDFVVLNVSSDCLSQPESALAESIVSTPEILLHDSDNPLVFPSPPSPGKPAGIPLQTSSAEDSGMEIGSEEFNPKTVQELLTRSTVSESTHYSLSTDFPPISSTIKTSSLDMSTIYDSVHEIASDAANDNTTVGVATGKGGVIHANELTNVSCDQNVELNGNSGTSETDSEDAKTLSEASEDVRVLSVS